MSWYYRIVSKAMQTMSWRSKFCQFVHYFLLFPSVPVFSIIFISAAKLGEIKLILDVCIVTKRKNISLKIQLMHYTHQSQPEISYKNEYCRINRQDNKQNYEILFSTFFVLIYYYTLLLISHQSLLFFVTTSPTL